MEEEEEEIEESLPQNNYNNSSLKIEETIVGYRRKNEITEEIIKKLISFYKYNKEIESKINDRNNEAYSPIYKTYYIVQTNWINNFLYFYNYDKIISIIEEDKKINLNSESIYNELYRIIRDKNIREVIWEEEELELNLNKYLREFKNFFPQEIILNDNQNKFNFYNDFIILDEELYNEIKDDKGNTHCFLHDPIKVNISIIKNNFIYKIDNNIFGFGIIQKSENENFYGLKVLIIAIIDKKFYSGIDIFKDYIKDIIKLKIKNNNYDLEVYSIENQNIHKMDITPFGDPSSNENRYFAIGYGLEEPIKDEYNDDEKLDKSNEMEEGKTSNNIKITNMEKINNLYIIEETKGDGNCLFNAFSKLIFGNEQYSKVIRQKICNFTKNNSKYKEFFESNEQEKHSNIMQREGEYGGEVEIKAFSNFCDIKLIWYIRDINDINNENNQNNNIRYNIYNEEKQGNFAIILNNNKKHPLLNHFSSCKFKNGNGISDEKLEQIKRKFLQEDDLSNEDNENNIYREKEKEKKRKNIFFSFKSESSENSDLDDEYNDFEKNVPFKDDENLLNDSSFAELTSYINNDNEKDDIKKNDNHDTSNNSTKIYSTRQNTQFTEIKNPNGNKESDIYKKMDEEKNKKNIKNKIYECLKQYENETIKNDDVKKKYDRRLNNFIDVEINKYEEKKENRDKSIGRQNKAREKRLEIYQMKRDKLINIIKIKENHYKKKFVVKEILHKDFLNKN